MYLYGLFLVGVALGSPCALHSLANADGNWNGWRPSSPSSVSVPDQGNYNPTPTVGNGWHLSEVHSHHSAAGSGVAPSWTLPSADAGATVLPLKKRTSSASADTTGGWGDWSSSWSSTKPGYAPTTSKTAGTTTTSGYGSSKTSYYTSFTSASTTGGYTSSKTSYSSSTSQTSTTSSSAGSTTTSSSSPSTTLSTLTSTKSTTSSLSSTGSTSTSTSTSGSTSTTTSTKSSISTTSSKTSTSSGTFQTSLLNPEDNLLYTLDVTIGDTSYELQVDTGSSDTWAAANVLPAGFDPIPNEYLYIEYADGDYALGPLANDTVTIAGLAVPEQLVSIANQSAGFGSDYVGIIGLSFNALTSENLGQEPLAADRPAYTGGQVHYSSIMNTIFNVDKLTSPLFSLALSRDSDQKSTSETYGGVFVIGGQPDLTDPTINVTTPIASTPMVRFNHDYTIAIDSATYGDQVLDQGAEFLVDSGTSLLLVPDASLTAYKNQFNPKPDSNGNVACNSTVPPLGFTIGGQTFFVNPADILRPNADGTCGFRVGNSGSNGGALGDTFLINVLAVFDWGAEEMKFGGREYYSVPT